MAQVHVDILKDAIKHFEKHPDEYICHYVTGCSPYSKKYRFNRYGQQIEVKIQELLAGYISYGGWLANRHAKFYNKNNFYNEQLVEGKIQWMQWMIENHHIFDNVKVK